MKFQNADIMIATPCYGGIETDTEMCIDRLYEYSKYGCPSENGRVPVNNIERVFAKATSPAWVRNGIVDQFLTTKYKSLLMIDRDHIFNYTYLQILFEADKDIIACLGTTKHESLETYGKGIAPYCSQLIDGKVVGYSQQEIDELARRNNGQPFEVAMTGMGMILIKKKVFEAIPRPWFAQEASNFENNPQGVGGEDYYFSKKAAEYGFKTFVHPGCALLHIGKGYYGMGSN